MYNLTIGFKCFLGFVRYLIIQGSNAAEERLFLETRVQHNNIPHNNYTTLVNLYFGNHW